jgi:DNA-binding CsgD family transcriptional regulator
VSNVTNLSDFARVRPEPLREAESGRSTSLKSAFTEVSHALYYNLSLAGAEGAIDQVGEILELPWAWWTPDAGHPYDCATAERFSRQRGWPPELMQLWRKHHISLSSPFHVRSRFESLPFVTLPDVRRRQHASSGYVRVNKLVVELGIRAMLHVPIHLPKGRIALVNWAGGREPSRLREILPQISGELLAIGHLFMRNYTGQAGQDQSIVEERARLTLREWDCLRMLAQGYRDAEAAELLQISKSTLRFHVENVVRKFGCKNRTHTIAMAAQLGLLGPIGH